MHACDFLPVQKFFLSVATVTRVHWQLVRTVLLHIPKLFCGQSHLHVLLHFCCSLLKVIATILVRNVTWKCFIFTVVYISADIIWWTMVVAANWWSDVHVGVWALGFLHNFLHLPCCYTWCEPQSHRPMAWHSADGMAVKEDKNFYITDCL